MRFEWDDAKNEANDKKHGVDFATASLVFEDPNVVLLMDRVVDGEERWHAIGQVAGSLLLLTVVHTYTFEEVVRIISAREATKRERYTYAEGIL